MQLKVLVLRCFCLILGGYKYKERPCLTSPLQSIMSQQTTTQKLSSLIALLDLYFMNYGLSHHLAYLMPIMWPGSEVPYMLTKLCILALLTWWLKGWLVLNWPMSSAEHVKSGLGFMEQTHLLLARNIVDQRTSAGSRSNIIDQCEA